MWEFMSAQFAPYEPQMNPVQYLKIPSRKIYSFYFTEKSIIHP